MNSYLIKTVKLCTGCIFTVNFSPPAAQRRSQVKWMTPVKPEKNVCPACALFQCSLVRSDAVSADHKATPPPPMKMRGAPPPRVMRPPNAAADPSSSAHSSISWSSDGVKDTSLKAKTKDFKIVLEDPRGRGLVLDDSNTVMVSKRCYYVGAH